jgi:hypothetical protein
MKKYIILICIISILLLITGCTSYRVSTGFYNLTRGMTKQQFIEWSGLYIGKNYVGKHPVTTRNFKIGDDVWEVWIFNVYRCPADCWWDHNEFVAFKNGRLDEWGVGDMPIAAPVMNRENYYRIRHQ